MAEIVANIISISSARGKGGGGVPPAGNDLLQENDFKLLLEDGGKILLEQE